MCDCGDKWNWKQVASILSIIVTLFVIQGYTYRGIDGRIDVKMQEHVIESNEINSKILERLSGLEKGQSILLERVE